MGTRVSLTEKVSAQRIGPLRLDPLLATLRLQLRRPTSADPLAWDREATIRAALVVLVDGEVRGGCSSEITGGIRDNRRQLHAELGEKAEGSEAFEAAVEEYGTSELQYAATVTLGAKGRAYLRNQPKDSRGFTDAVPLTRLAEEGTDVVAYLELTLLRGTAAELEVLAFESTAAPAPEGKEHNSVGFDAATSAQELNGDGVISLTHTSTGSNRGWCGIARWDTAGSGDGHTSMTYGGAGATEVDDRALAVGAQAQMAVYAGVNQATGAQTVTSTVVAFEPRRHFFGVISMTGVHQTTPVGSAFFANGTNGTPTVTVTSVGTDDLVIDGVSSGSGNSPSVGSDQAQRNTQNEGTEWFRMSSQPGTAGGVMSWSISGGADYWGIVAVAFKPSGGTAYTLDMGAGSYGVTGAAVGLLFGRLIGMASGSYAVGGQAVGLLFGRKVAMDAGSYSVSGQDVTLTKASPGSFSLDMGSGSYTLTGSNLSLLLGRRLDLAAGSYAVNGQPVTLLLGRKIDLAAGSYAVTGSAAGLLFGRLIGMANGVYSLSGQAMNLLRGLRLDMGAGAYGVSGQDVALLLQSPGQFAIAMNAGSYLLVGTALAFRVGHVLAMGGGTYVVTGRVVDLRYNDGTGLEVTLPTTTTLAAACQPRTTSQALALAARTTRPT